MVKNSAGLMLALLLLGQLPSTSPDVPDGQQHEVQHLLNFIANSHCIIDRNGSQHNGQDALAHIQKKYAYFRDDITSTESFIEYSASKSTFSGKNYTVVCDDHRKTSQQWLLDELATYRSTRNED